MLGGYIDVASVNFKSIWRQIMLTEIELFQLYQNLNLSQEAQQIITKIRSSPPVRRVRSAAGNVSVRYPSRKMGITIQAESHRNELAGIYEKEYDPETLEYYDQPSRIKLTYEAKNGRGVGIWHTPDYFVIRSDSIGWEEWKTEAELLRLAEQMPHRYVQALYGNNKYSFQIHYCNNKPNPDCPVLMKM